MGINKSLKKLGDLLSHKARKWWSQSLNQGMSDSYVHVVNHDDSEKGREPKAGFLGMAASQGTVGEEEPRENTEKERPER